MRNFTKCPLPCHTQGKKNWNQQASSWTNLPKSHTKDQEFENFPHQTHQPTKDSSPTHFLCGSSSGRGWWAVACVSLRLMTVCPCPGRDVLARSADVATTAAAPQSPAAAHLATWAGSWSGSPAGLAPHPEQDKIDRIKQDCNQPGL